MKTARLVWAGAWMNLKLLTVSRFFLMTSIVQPVIFATIAFFLFRAGAREESLLYVSLGAGLMGIWSTTLFASGGMLRWQRNVGTLELVVAAPPPLLLVLGPMSLGIGAIGLYSVAATLFWGWVFFDVPLTIEDPVLFALALPATVVALGSFGLVLAASFIHYRHTNALGNLLEYPVWLVSGLLVPLSLLPGWATPLAWAIAPTWGVRAVREAALGGKPLLPIAACVTLAGVYLVVASFLLRYFERLARRDATLALTSG
jgi:ABC-2 type transport system permease protein